MKKNYFTEIIPLMMVCLALHKVCNNNMAKLIVQSLSTISAEIENFHLGITIELNYAAKK